MSLFDKFASGTKDNEHIANGVSTVLHFLDEYERDGDFNHLIFAAYITRIAVLDTFEKSGYNPAYICFSNINGKLTRITWLQANLLTYGKISDCIENMDLDSRKLIESILDRGQAFVMIDRKFSYEEKKVYID